MEINSAEFVKSSSHYKDCPNLPIPEYAFIGRSNVGKSSLINSLTQKKGLAKTSSTPGKTQLINHFLINENWYLTDLPGYGYARVSKKNREKFSQIITNYLLNRTNLVVVFILIDSRHEPLKNDLEFMEWLNEKGIPFNIIFTKSDKVGAVKVLEHVENYKKKMLETWEETPEMFITSATKKSGCEEILQYIDKLNRTYPLIA